jgi:hypothetical protein
MLHRNLQNKALAGSNRTRARRKGLTRKVRPLTFTASRTFDKSASGLSTYQNLLQGEFKWDDIGSENTTPWWNRY